MILTIRTDKPEAEIGIFGINGEKFAYDKWQAHRELGSTLNERIEVFLQAADVDWSEITKIVFYEGPGSFTGLRIGASVANALAYSYSVPIVGSGGDDWINKGISIKSEVKYVTPEYGGEVYITKQKK